jgi:hypothetical protein
MRALDQLKRYGPTGLGTYLAISGCTFSFFFIAIETHLDIHGWVRFCLGDTVDPKETLEKWGMKPAEPGGWSLQSKATSAVLAVVASKALIPVKIPLAVALTPYVHRFLRHRGLIRA